jgi:preprotein translocase subunit Sec63
MKTTIRVFVLDLPSATSTSAGRTRGRAARRVVVMVTVMVVMTDIGNDGVAAAAPHANTAEASQNGDDYAEHDEEASEDDDSNDPADNTRTISATARSILRNIAS